MTLRFPCAALVLFFASACGGAPTAPEGPSVTAPSAGGGDAAAGEKLFAGLGCKGCHGSRAEPGGVGPNLHAITWTPAEEAEARNTITNGRPDHEPPMPKYEGEVDEKKMGDLLAYLRSK